MSAVRIQERCGLRSGYQLYEVPIFFSGVAVALYVADYFRVYLCGGVESERCFDNVVLEVAVDGFGATDNLHTGIMSLVVLGEYGGIGVRVVTAYYNQGVDAKLFDDYKTFFKLLFAFELCASGTDNVETAGVAVFINNRSGKFDVLVVYEAAGAIRKPNRRLSRWIFLIPSNRPQITLCPPGA